MKRILTIITLGLLSVAASFAQKAPGPFEPVPSLPITGTMSIDYRSRRAPGKEGVTDMYTTNIMVANSAVYKGTISHLPFIKNTLGRNQAGRLIFDMDLEVVNPANIRQTRNVGKIFGSAGIDETNAYRFSDGGGVKIAVNPIGAARGFESRFNGVAYGKPPAASGWAKIRKETVTLVSGKGGKITLVNYDVMRFENHVLPAGPVQIYPETSVNGTLFYDYNRSAWHFNNLRFEYNAEGKRASDVLTGSIRWIEAKNRKATGDGRYEFDIRVNEPPPTESQVFSAVADEASFFASNDDVASLTGAMIYKDSFAGETVTSSTIQIDLKASKLSKVQAMYLSKLLLLSAIVPLNAE